MLAAAAAADAEARGPQGDAAKVSLSAGGWSPIRSLAAYPVMASGWLQLRNKAGNSIGHCTGTMIGDYTLVTAGAAARAESEHACRVVCVAGAHACACREWCV
jgi:hypothetical protein